MRVDATVLGTVEAAFTEHMGSLVDRHHIDDTLHVLEFDGAGGRDIRTYVSVGLARRTLQLQRRKAAARASHRKRWLREHPWANQPAL